MSEDNARLLERLARQIARQERAAGVRSLRRLRGTTPGRGSPRTRPLVRPTAFPEVRGTGRNSPYDKAVRSFAKEHGYGYQETRESPQFQKEYKAQSLRERQAALRGARYGWRADYQNAVDHTMWRTGKSYREVVSDPAFQKAYRSLRDIDKLRDQWERQGLNWRLEMDRRGMRDKGGEYEQALVTLGYRSSDETRWIPGDTPRHGKRMKG